MCSGWDRWLPIILFTLLNLITIYGAHRNLKKREEALTKKMQDWEKKKAEERQKEAERHVIDLEERPFFK